MASSTMIDASWKKATSTQRWGMNLMDMGKVLGNIWVWPTLARPDCRKRGRRTRLGGQTHIFPRTFLIAILTPYPI